MKWNKYKDIFMYIALLYLGGATIFTRYKMSSPQADIGSIIGFLFFIPLFFAVLKKKNHYRGFFLILRDTRNFIF